MGKKAKATPIHRTKIDPLFQIPEGAEDSFAYTRQFVESDEEFEQRAGEDFDHLADGLIEDDIEYLTLDTPTDFSVISQKIRRAPGGQNVVDIVVQINDDILGAENYEVRITKVDV